MQCRGSTNTRNSNIHGTMKISGGEGEGVVARALPTPAVVIRPKLPAYVGSSGSHLVRPLSTIV